MSGKGIIQMVPIISIVGYADAGKTTLIEKLVPELKKRGYRVGTIKHSVHASNFDTKGKDSWRHFSAGADTVVVASADRIAMFKRVKQAPGNLDDQLSGLERCFDDMDLVIAEGFKNAKRPKIEVFRPEVHDSPLCLDDDMLIAVVTDAEIEIRVPLFGLSEVQGLAALIEKNYL
jgi:molybdopterin-guanine dinucleotide biosynthesis protein B